MSYSKDCGAGLRASIARTRRLKFITDCGRRFTLVMDYSRRFTCIMYYGRGTAEALHMLNRFKRITDCGRLGIGVSA